jgi:NAD(P)-dependent dehydrogenase (short-subunit alcohol dehydrogenase family)
VTAHLHGHIRPLAATFLTLQTFLLAMIEEGGGAIVTMSSSAARQVERTSAAYAAAMVGVTALTRQLASETAPNVLWITGITLDVGGGKVMR